MAKAPKRIGVLTGGGDCPGLNAALRAIVKTADNDSDMEVIDSMASLENRISQNGFIEYVDQNSNNLLDDYDIFNVYIPPTATKYTLDSYLLVFGNGDISSFEIYQENDIKDINIVIFIGITRPANPLCYKQRILNFIIIFSGTISEINTCPVLDVVLNSVVSIFTVNSTDIKDIIIHI